MEDRGSGGEATTEGHAEGGSSVEDARGGSARGRGGRLVTHGADDVTVDPFDGGGRHSGGEKAEDWDCTCFQRCLEALGIGSLIGYPTQGRRI